jgi:hypothetical protein
MVYIKICSSISYYYHNFIIFRKGQNEKDFLGISMEEEEERIRKCAEKREENRRRKKGKAKKMLSDIGGERRILRK